MFLRQVVREAEVVRLAQDDLGENPNEPTGKISVIFALFPGMAATVPGGSCLSSHPGHFGLIQSTRMQFPGISSLRGLCCSKIKVEYSVR